jgi:hypothetical protein
MNNWAVNNLSSFSLIDRTTNEVVCKGLKCSDINLQENTLYETERYRTVLKERDITLSMNVEGVDFDKILNPEPKDFPKTLRIEGSGIKEYIEVTKQGVDKIQNAFKILHRTKSKRIKNKQEKIIESINKGKGNNKYFNKRKIKINFIMPKVEYKNNNEFVAYADSGELWSVSIN